MNNTNENVLDLIKRNRNENYKVYVACTNCDFIGIREIPKGTKVHETACVSCGCKTLRKR